MKQENSTQDQKHNKLKCYENKENIKPKNNVQMMKKIPIKIKLRVKSMQ